MSNTDEATFKRVCEENPDLPEEMVRDLLDWKQRERDGLNEEPVSFDDMVDRVFPNSELEDF